jgi:putative dimethyl sulfoxide reductase chaperone
MTEMTETLETREEAELGPQDQARARSRLYGLLARLFIRGVDEHALAQLGVLGWTPLEGQDGPGFSPELLEALQVEHHATFALGVFPYAGVFLAASASAGGFADEVRRHYARAGFTPLLDELTADHLGIELAFLAYVTGAQADALADGHTRLAADLDRQLASFLDACVLSWLPSFVVAAESLAAGNGDSYGLDRATSSPGFWARIGRETLDLVAEHRSRLPGAIAPPQLVDPGDLLADEHTGLRRIVEHLLTPAASGVFATRSDIVALGRARELPRGFGSRLLMLDNLLRSAVEYGELPSLLANLDEQLAQRDHDLGRVAAATSLDPAIRPWRDAITHTRALLRDICDSATG